MAVAETFTKTGPTLVNFDFTDILADVGYVTVFALKDIANKETLVRQTLPSDEQRVSFSPSSPGLQGEHNWDFEFRTPTRLDGLCYVQITYFAQAVSSQTADCQVKVRLIHLDTAASETEIAAQQASDVVEETTNTSTLFNNVTFSFDINQAFAKNEKFRLEVEVHSTTTTSAVAGYLIDPANRDDGQTASTISPTSFLKVLLPFPLET